MGEVTVHEINWDFVEQLDMVCVECKLDKFTLASEYNMLPYKPKITREEFIKRESSGNCEGHTIIYLPFEEDIRIQEDGEFEVFNWAIIHHTDRAYIELRGDVPKEYLKDTAVF